jgi:signal peptidase II
MIQRRHLILLSLSGAIVSFDQLLKTMVINRFKQGEVLSVLNGFFNITFLKNDGTAFGLLSSLDPHVREPLLAIIPLLTLATVLFVFQRLSDKDRVLIYSLTFIVGGSVGNLIDRARVGYIIDFLDFHWHDRFHFPSFNIADGAIVSGIALLLYYFYAGNPEEKVT